MIFILALIGACFKKITHVFYLFLGISICSVLLWSIGDRMFHLHISREILLHLISVWFKIGAIILMGIIFASCIIVEELAYGLSRLGIPSGLLPLFINPFRWMSLYHETKENSICGQELRGMDIASQGIKERLSSCILCISITNHKFKIITAAMEARGFGISHKRSYSDNYRVGVIDYITLSFLVFFGAFCLFLRLSGYGVG